MPPSGKFDRLDLEPLEKALISAEQASSRTQLRIDEVKATLQAGIDEIKLSLVGEEVRLDGKPRNIGIIERVVALEEQHIDHLQNISNLRSELDELKEQLGVVGTTEGIVRKAPEAASDDTNDLVSGVRWAAKHKSTIAVVLAILATLMHAPQGYQTLIKLLSPQAETHQVVDEAPVDAAVPTPHERHR